MDAGQWILTIGFIPLVGLALIIGWIGEMELRRSNAPFPPPSPTTSAGSSSAPASSSANPSSPAP